MPKAIVSIAVGLVVGVAAGLVAFSFMMAATWSSIHGGSRGARSQISLAGLSILATAAPLVPGLLAGFGTHRMLDRSTHAMSSPGETTEDKSPGG